MDVELICIGIFALCGCVFFIVFLVCFHRALQATEGGGLVQGGGRHSHGAQQDFPRTISITAFEDVVDDTTSMSTLGAPPAPGSLSRSSTMTAYQYSSNLHFMKRLSRSLTAERSALIMPCIIRELSVAEIEAATDKFSTSNIIRRGHSGDIYRGVLEGGEVVVIKRLVMCVRKSADNACSTDHGPGSDDVLIKHGIGANKDYYAAEMDVYGKVLDQTFLVPVLGQCLASQEEKFLVYEYMAYGDLASILARARAHPKLAEKQTKLLTEEAHKEDDGISSTTATASASTTTTTTTTASTSSTRSAADTSPTYSTTTGAATSPAATANVNHGTVASDAGELLLAWPVRMKIARGVAEALVYLHHQSRPPLSHRNIQGSSILLNRDFEVKLGSLGDAQKIESGELPVYDIYCFGRLLLDLISGLDISGNGGDEAVQAWVSTCFHALTASAAAGAIGTSTASPSLPPALHMMFTSELIDRNLVPLMQENHVMEIIQVAQLAKLCMEPTTLQRLTMKGVLNLLSRPNHKMS